MIIRSTNTSLIVLSPPFSPLFNLSCSSAAPCFFPPTIKSVSMATLTNFLSNPPATSTSKINPLSFRSSFSVPFLPKHSFLPAKCYANRPPPHHHHLVTKATAASGSAAAATPKKPPSDERVQKIHNIEEFDQALKSAKDRLVVVEYAASHSKHSSRIYPFLVELSRTCNDVDFLLVMGDESDATAALCDREKVEKVPHFSFYKSMEKVHEECWVEPDQLMGDVLYYGDNHSGVVQLHSKDDVERLVEDHKADRKLIVLDVGLKHCGPCVKVYPTVVKLSKQMADTVVFARMNGDENESCMEYLKEKDVIEVPTFLFIRDGMIRGRYVGSGKGELIGEILRYQGVRVTY